MCGKKKSLKKKVHERTALKDKVCLSSYIKDKGILDLFVGDKISISLNGCLFCNERAATFYIDHLKNTWGCLSCGSHGDIYNLRELLYGESYETIKEELKNYLQQKETK